MTQVSDGQVSRASKWLDLLEVGDLCDCKGGLTLNECEPHFMFGVKHEGGV